MADYYIYAVHQEDEVIKKVKTCTSYTTSGGPSTESEKTKDTVVSDINSGKTVFTIYKDVIWKLGELVVIETIDKIKYIKTKRNGTKKDNLDNIAPY